MNLKKSKAEVKGKHWKLKPHKAQTPQQSSPLNPLGSG